MKTRVKCLEKEAALKEWLITIIIISYFLDGRNIYIFRKNSQDMFTWIYICEHIFKTWAINGTVLKKVGRGVRDFRNQTELFSETKEELKGAKDTRTVWDKEAQLWGGFPVYLPFLVEWGVLWLTCLGLGWRLRILEKIELQLSKTLWVVFKKQVKVFPNSEEPAKASVTPFVRASVHRTAGQASEKFRGLGTEEKSRGDPWE